MIFNGLIMAMPADDPKWSFIRYDSEGYMTIVREKEGVSKEAKVGIYNYRHGVDFVRYTHQMIAKNIRVNDEFYVAPAYNEMIKAGGKVGYYDIGQKMYGLGTPRNLEMSLKGNVSRKAFDG